MAESHKIEEAVVAHLLRGDGEETEVLLGCRNSLFCNGIWNGPGGHFEEEDGGDMLKCLRRELREEVRITVDVTSVKHFATLDCYYPNGNGHRQGWKVHFLSVTRWKGEPSIREGFSELRWFPRARLPYAQMMPDQIAWMPLALSYPQNGSLLNVDIFYAGEDSRVVTRGQFRFVRRTT